ncbi:preprotein translocase subunit SecG [Sphingorhabdus sp. IMCC26285]|uniref:Protein-export membrane protein SecG n=1 Tax=Sphingorhabdus profundilacus TaxID=2509718 RepID=A0A6I4LYA7_9SPHN|nr:preprotein translocase subunit SecG [Sphingorhabdus profundilacus]MVZ97000.1 preprotein translocase subunit SecG [Sphingorhabdus profundilacus]
MGLFHFLIVVQAIVSASLVGVVLMQRSEGGGLGMGGSPSGLMSARGAADFMTRLTTILATMFILLSISLAFVAAREGGTSKIDTSLQRTEVPATQPAPAEPAEQTPAKGDTTAPAPQVPLDK